MVVQVVVRKVVRMGVRFMVMSMLLRLMVIDNDDEVGSFIGSDDKVE